MRYIFIALTMSLMAASYAFSDELTNQNADQATIDQSANADSDSLNLQEGNSSNWGWWNRNFGYGYGYGYGLRGCGYSYPVYYGGCGGYNYFSSGFYNPNYLYRVAPMAY